MQLEVTGLTKAFWWQSVLRAVDLRLPAGRIMAVLGVNGAGKSTLLRCLATQLVADRGTMTIDGQPLRRDTLELRRRLHYVPDAPPAVDRIDVVTQTALVLEAYGHRPPGIEQTVADLIIEFGLQNTEYKLLAELSRGQLYKAALVALVALDRDLWLVDEPFGSGMDPRGLNAFRRHARLAAKRGRTVLYTTQIFEMVTSLADSVAVLDAGTLSVFDSLEALRADPGGHWQSLVDVYGDPQTGGGAS